MKNGQLLHNGRYQIVSPLGKGGMGAVYLCRDRKLSRRIAIKENRDTRPDSQQQFSQEAVILARLDHPCLPKVLDYFIEPSGSRYLVMEYIEGQALKRILNERNQPLPEEEALSWISQILAAVHYMHTWVDPNTGEVTPIVHRDIKPANIRLRADGRVTLVDFGIARLQVGREAITAARGTTSPGYSPLEQYSSDTDERADIYALGATLYSLVTRTVPVKSTDRANGQPLAAPRHLNPKLSLNTDLAIQTAMAQNPIERYNSAAEMYAALNKSTIDGQVSWQSEAVSNAVGTIPAASSTVSSEKSEETRSAPAGNVRSESIYNSSTPAVSQPRSQRSRLSIVSLIGLLLLGGLSWLILNNDYLNTFGTAVFPGTNTPAVQETVVVLSTATRTPVETSTSPPLIVTSTPFPAVSATVTHTVTSAAINIVTNTATNTVTSTPTSRPVAPGRLRRTPIPTNTLVRRTEISVEQTRIAVTPVLLTQPLEQN